MAKTRAYTYIFDAVRHDSSHALITNLKLDIFSQPPAYFLPSWLSSWLDLAFAFQVPISGFLFLASAASVPLRFRGFGLRFGCGSSCCVAPLDQ